MLKTPQTDGIWRIGPDDPNVQRYDDPASGEWFVGYRSDGWALIYDEACPTVLAKSCHADEAVRSDATTDRVGVRTQSIEHWVRENTDQIAALHPRYYWLLERDNT